MPQCIKKSKDDKYKMQRRLINQIIKLFIFFILFIFFLFYFFLFYFILFHEYKYQFNTYAVSWGQCVIWILMLLVVGVGNHTNTDLYRELDKMTILERLLLRRTVLTAEEYSGKTAKKR